MNKNEEITTKPEKDITKKSINYKEFFNETVIEDKELILNICDAADKALYLHFRIKYGDEDPELIGVIFKVIFDTLINELLKRRESKSSFEVNIADILKVGFSTTDDEEEEKQGNIMIYFKHMNSTSFLKNLKYVRDKADSSEFESTSKSKQRCTDWYMNNIKEDPTFLLDVANRAIENLKDFNIFSNTPDILWPTFVLVYVTAVNVLATVRLETKEFFKEINFMDCFNIGVRETDNDSKDLIDAYVRPMIDKKLDFKSDQIASSKYDN